MIRFSEHTFREPRHKQKLFAIMHETNAEFGPREEENIFDVWIFGVIFIVLGVIAILYYLRYVVTVQPNIWMFCLGGKNG